LTAEQLYNFYREMGDRVHPDDRVSDSRYQHVIVGSGVVGAVFAVILGVLIFRVGPAHVPLTPKVLMARLVFIATGAVLGAAAAFTFAPVRFLRGRSGRGWMRLVGTERPVIARIVCSICTLLFLGFLAGMAWSAWSHARRGF
jgi:hypothetical protein